MLLVPVPLLEVVRLDAALAHVAALVAQSLQVFSPGAHAFQADIGVVNIGLLFG